MLEASCMQLQASIQRLCVWCAYAVRRPTQSCAAVSVCCSLPCTAASTRCSLPCAAAVLHKARDIAVAGLATLTKRWSQSHQRSRRRPRSTTTRQVLYMYFDYYTKLQLSHTTSLRKCTRRSKLTAANSPAAIDLVCAQIASHTVRCLSLQPG